MEFSDKDYPRVEENDPRRCQAVSANGQCSIKAIDGNIYCPVHAGNSIRKAERQSLKNYRITQFNARLQELGNSDGIKSLRDEIGILRLLLEERWNSCQNPNDLIINSGPIKELVSAISDIVSKCHKLEGSMGMLVDKSAIIQFAGRVVKIIGEDITNEEVLDRISSKIIKAITETDDAS